MNDINVNGPSLPSDPSLHSQLQDPATKNIGKTEQVASRELGIVDKNSRKQGDVKNLFKSSTAEKFGKSIHEFAEKVVQRLKSLALKSRKERDPEARLKNIISDFKEIDKRISDFEEHVKPLDLNDPDSVMEHQQHIAEFRHDLQQLRDKAESFDNPSVKADILTVANGLMLRVDDLLTEKFNVAEFFKGPPKAKHQPDEELVKYFEGPNYEEDIDDLLRELEQFPEGEMPDEIPAAAKESFEELDKDLEELANPDPWDDWNYSEDGDNKKL